MKILTHWLRSYLPVLPTAQGSSQVADANLQVDDAQLAEDLTLRGIAVEGIFELNDKAGYSDAALFDMDITTNRVDAMNHYGIAREAAAIYNVPLHPLDNTLPARTPTATPFSVRIDEPTLCGRFTAQVIRGVTIRPSEGLVSHYFTELGQKQISNAVDATNYVLLGMGQPTHAFDLDKIDGGIIVRKARAGEQIKLLDGSTRTLVADDLVVADDSKALGLAGVMGGWDTMITAQTKNVLVEAAWFDPATVRASSRRHLLHTDASHRFERGADFNAAPIANALVTRHILTACGGTLEGALIDIIIPSVQAKTAGRPPIALSVPRVQRLLGKTIAPEGITAELVTRFLTALGCRLTPSANEEYLVTLPSWRLDLEREIDLIEEIARVYGYNGFANTLPTPAAVVAHPTEHAERALRQRLFALGYSEAISSTFASQADSDLFVGPGSGVPLENPLNAEAANLRPSLLPGMVTMLAYNLTRDVTTARLFEVGTTFSGGTEQVNESPNLSLGLTGTFTRTSLHSALDAPFFELKGVVESVLSLFGATPIFTTANVSNSLESGRSANITLSGQTIGALGQLASAEASRRKLRQPLWLAQLDLGTLLKLPLRAITTHDLSRYQAVERDFSFTIADSLSWQQITDAIHALAIDEMRSLEPVEIFRDPAKLAAQASILIRVVFQSTQRTLEEADLTTWSTRIVTAIEALGGKLRAGA